MRARFCAREWPEGDESVCGRGWSCATGEFGIECVAFLVFKMANKPAVRYLQTFWARETCNVFVSERDMDSVLRNVLNRGY